MRKRYENAIHIDDETEQLLREVVATYGRSLINFAYTYLKDWGLAEDAVQEVYVKWLSKFRALQGDQALRSWLYQTTANQCKDFLRKSKRNVHLFKRLKEKSMLRNGENPETILLNQAKEKHLADRVLLLPIIYREVVILYYYEDYSTLQIAEILNIKPSTVNTRLARARALLKDRLGDEDFEE